MNTNVTEELVLDSVLWNNFDWMVSYYRSNIHRFATEYFGIQLKDFQKVLLYGMDDPELLKFEFFASRGLGKSWLTMVYALCKGTLYPNIKIKIAAPTVGQAKVIIEKIEEIKRDYPIVEREIKEYRNVKDYAKVTLMSGAVIETVVSGANARGGRCQIFICDEIRGMNKTEVVSDMEPFLTETRRPLYLNNPKYAHLEGKENNKRIYLTSIGYKDEWVYKDYLECMERMLSGDKRYKVVSMPYQFGIKTGIINRGYVESKVLENRDNVESFQMEMEVMPYGETEFAMFKYDQVNSVRKLIVPMVPPTDKEWIACKGDIKKFQFYQKKEQGEIRIISMDVAVAAGRTNDNSVFMLFRLFDNGDYYSKEIPFVEGINGMPLDDQVLRLKQLFYDFECDYAVVDAGGGLGISAIDSIGRKTYDRIRNRRYPGWRTANRNDKFDSRVKDSAAEPVLFTIQVSGTGASQLQYDMLINAQLEFERNHMLLLCNEEDAINELNQRYEYFALKTSNDSYDRERASLMYSSFSNTSALVKECITTQIVKTQSGRWTFDEGKGRKDRVICMIYGLYIISMLEKDLEKDTNAYDVHEYFSSQNVTSKNHSANPFYKNNIMQKLWGFGRK